MKNRTHYKFIILKIFILSIIFLLQLFFIAYKYGIYSSIQNVIDDTLFYIVLISLIPITFYLGYSLIILQKVRKERTYMKKKNIKKLTNVIDTLQIEDNVLIKEKWDKEDELLNSRTGSFLTVNAILFAITQIPKTQIPSHNIPYLNLGIAAIGIIITILWLIVSYRTSIILRYYASISKKFAPIFIKYITTHHKIKHLSPNVIIAVLLPSIILFCWLSFILIFIYFDCFTKLYFIITGFLILICILFFLIFYICRKRIKLDRTITKILENGKD